MGDRQIESSENNTKIVHIDDNIIYGWSMCQYLPYKNIQLTTDVSLNEILEGDD